ncbi:MAG: hypothetical protein ACLUFV_06990 [Acutalibacteraceae bacterium]
MLQHGDATGGEAEQYAGQKRQQEAGRDPREGEQHRAPEIRLEHERGKTAQHRCGGGEEKLLPISHAAACQTASVSSTAPARSRRTLFS